MEAPDKGAVLATLSRALARHYDDPTGGSIAALVAEREALATTIVADGVALPHAVLDHSVQPRIALALSHVPVVWHAPDRAVRLIVLVVSDLASHLRALRAIATALRTAGTTDRLMAAQNGDDLYQAMAEALADTYLTPSREDGAARQAPEEVSRAVIAAAEQLRQALPGATLVVNTEAFSNPVAMERILRNVACRRVETSVDPSGDPAAGRPAGDEDGPMIVVAGEPLSDRLGSIRVVPRSRAFGADIAPADTRPEVIQRVLDVAHELALEGREGKPVGAAFIVGDYPAVAERSHQLIVNPFHGYPETSRNILDPSLAETIKEFVKIDGAILIRGDGVVEAAGAYLAVGPQLGAHRSGYGARHASAQGLTGQTGAVAIVISESTRRVTVFAAGRRVAP